jgi:predicted ATPase
MLSLEFDDPPLGREERERIFHSLLQALGLRGATTVAIGEDAHWAARASLEMLRFFGCRIGEMPALIIVSYRDIEIGANYPLRMVLEDLATRTTLHRLARAPRSERAGEQLAERAGRNPEAVHRLTSRSPLFLSV